MAEHLHCPPAPRADIASQSQHCESVYDLLLLLSSALQYPQPADQNRTLSPESWGQDVPRMQLRDFTSRLSPCLPGLLHLSGYGPPRKGPPSPSRGFIMTFSGLFTQKNNLKSYFKTALVRGLPWWLSGKESACQCRRYKFDP